MIAVHYSSKKQKRHNAKTHKDPFLQTRSWLPMSNKGHMMCLGVTSQNVKHFPCLILNQGSSASDIDT